MTKEIKPTHQKIIYVMSIAFFAVMFLSSVTVAYHVMKEGEVVNFTVLRWDGGRSYIHKYVLLVDGKDEYSVSVQHKMTVGQSGQMLFNRRFPQQGIVLSHDLNYTVIDAMGGWRGVALSMFTLVMFVLHIIWLPSVFRSLSQDARQERHRR